MFTLNEGQLFRHHIQPPVQQYYTATMQMASQNSDKMYAATARNLLFMPSANKDATY